jgi:hypothetical protein
MRALGLKSDKEIAESIMLEKRTQSLLEASFEKEQEEVIYLNSFS